MSWFMIEPYKKFIECLPNTLIVLLGCWPVFTVSQPLNDVTYFPSGNTRAMGCCRKPITVRLPGFNSCNEKWLSTALVVQLPQDSQ